MSTKMTAEQIAEFQKECQARKLERERQPKPAEPERDVCAKICDGVDSFSDGVVSVAKWIFTIAAFLVALVFIVALLRSCNLNHPY